MNALHIARAAGAAFEPGRAGMLYRDLMPPCADGRFVASHIAIPTAGPVGDWVHYHRIAVQFLVCRTGWARLVYEDQGEPFVFEAGDLVLQPPLIRHQVLDCSAGFEVVEIASPARHETLADARLALPNDRLAPEREFSGQRFLHARAAEGSWTPLAPGWERRDTGLGLACGGLADAMVARPRGKEDLVAPPFDGGLSLGVLLAGEATLNVRGAHALAAADAFVAPAGEGWRLSHASADLQLLLVTSPAS